jgi:galactose mutarotase-like enzyme
MSTHFIESPFLKIEVKNEGASLLSIFDRERGFEYLNREGMRNFFPVVGALKDDRYRIGRKYYPMQSNGFLSDQEFEVLRQEDDRVRLQFEANDQTYSIYPYRFLIKIDYFVYGPILKIIWTIENLEKKEMLFSLGSRYVLNLPTKGEELSDYYWAFEEPEKFGAYYLQNGLINFDYKDDRTVFLKGNIPLDKDIFRNGPLVFRDPESEMISLKSKRNESEIEFKFDNSRFVRLNLQKENLSIGIAQGINDYIFHNHDLYTKEGILQLDPLGVHQEVLEIKFK